jgi:hypothetical protein
VSEHHCRYCEQDHDERWLCDQARRLLAALYARGADLTMPDVVLPEPIPLHETNFGLDPAKGDALAVQIAVEAASLSLGGVYKPALIFTGLDSYHRPLPRWLLAGDPADIDAIAALITRMATCAIRTADWQNRGPA